MNNYMKNNENKEIVVSVYCLAYNHAKYIRNALDGFVNQKTKFKYEVIIHDDASTDETAEIIQEYVEKYPDIFISIYQTENQYSKKNNIVDTYILPLIKGKYVAICEGDDYWCDEYKLQKQVDVLEAHEECSFCAHYVQKISSKSGKPLGFFPNKKYELESGIVPDGVHAEISFFDLFQLSSVLVKSEHFIRLRRENPNFKKNHSTGDIPLLLYLLLKGKCYFLADIMSHYRVNSDGSWTQRVGNNLEMQVKYAQNKHQLYKEFNEYSANKYYEYAKRGMQISENVVLRNEKKFRQLLSKECRSVMSTPQIIFISICSVFPFMYDFYRKISHWNKKRR